MAGAPAGGRPSGAEDPDFDAPRAAAAELAHHQVDVALACGTPQPIRLSVNLALPGIQLTWLRGGWHKGRGGPVQRTLRVGGIGYKVCVCGRCDWWRSNDSMP